MNIRGDDLIAVHARVENALKLAWAQGLAGSNPVAVLLVAFDSGDGPADNADASNLERTLRVHCGRDHDIVLRRRHDEFIAILPETPPAGARRVGEQIVDAMRSADNGQIHRVSVGVAVSVPDEQQAPSNLLRRAESALQAAREHGGDRCIGCGTATGAPPSPKSTLAQLRDLLPRKKKDPDFKRRTD